jgi:Zn-dependent M28 family amino/carboxypeptidase
MAALLLLTLSACTAPPSAVDPGSDAARLRAHVETLSIDFSPRDHLNTGNLDRCAAYISGHFRRAGGTVSEQVYEVDGRTYCNVLASFGSGSRIVVGAHYDAFGNTPGADDNASGVAALIELAYLLGRRAPDHRIDLVAFTLEEPPHYGTPNMGSARHAASLAKAGADVEFMVSLDMVGYSGGNMLSRLPGPLGENRLVVVGRNEDRAVAERLAAAMGLLAVCKDQQIPWVGWSDHANYWPHGYNGVFICDSIYRLNPNYETSRDTADTLDYVRLARTVSAFSDALMGWSTP